MADPKRDAVKLQTLRQQGTLYPHAAAVTDPLFQQYPFFDPRDVVQVKYEMLRRVEIDHVSVSEASTAFGFSRPSFYQAQVAFAQHGLAGLLPRKRRPRNAHKLTAKVINFLSELRRGEPTLGPAELAQRVHQHFGISVHPRSSERCLRSREKNGAEYGKSACRAPGTDCTL